MFEVSTGLLVLLLLFDGACTQELTKEGTQMEITCDPKGDGQTVWWFRLKDNKMFEFIASYGSKGAKAALDKTFNYEKLKNNILTLTAFKKAEDSGSYSCVVIKNNQLQFGQVTKLQGPPDPAPEVKVITTTRAAVENPTTKFKCEPKTSVKKTANVATILGCDLMILIPLATGSGLLLILLIITILYCNRIRTRRCPHHYKRQPRNRPGGHRPLPNQPEFYPM